jgi:hypothetical protein
MRNDQNREAVGEAGGLFQYCQLPDKNFCKISRHIWNFLAVFRNLYWFTARFLAKPLNDVQRKRRAPQNRGGEIVEPTTHSHKKYGGYISS